MSRYSHYQLPYQTLFAKVQRFMLCLHKTNYGFLNINCPPRPYFWFLTKKKIIKSCSLLERLSVHKMSWSHVDWSKFCIHARRQHIGNGRSYEIKKCLRRGHLQWHGLPIESHKYLLIDSQVIDGDTDRQKTEWWPPNPHIPFQKR
jgi:hypothetical protein